MRIGLLNTVCIAAAVFLAAGSAAANLIESAVVHRKAGNLFFAHGREAGVWPGCRFYFVGNGDTLCSGLIIESLRGLSVGEDFCNPTAVELMDSAVTLYLGVVEIDSVTPLTIGWLRGEGLDESAVRYFDVDSEFAMLASPAALYRKAGPKPDIRRYQSLLKMTLDFEAGKIDGYLAYEPYSGELDDVATISSAAPYVALIIPNIEESINAGGYLSTSLYYRYDPARLPLMFDGKNPTAVFSFREAAGKERSFAYDPNRGHQLLARVRSDDKTVTIATESGELRSTADYFTDILSRDRLRVSSGVGGGDVQIALAPSPPSNPFAPMTFLIDRLAIKGIESGGELASSVKLAASYLQEAARDSSRSDYFLSLTERTLIEDIGLFPLYRPTLYFTSSKNVINAGFTVDGILDLTKAVKIRIPSSRLSEGDGG